MAQRLTLDQEQDGIERAIDEAARDLPISWIVKITIERGEVSVTLESDEMHYYLGNARRNDSTWSTKATSYIGKAPKTIEGKVRYATEKAIEMTAEKNKPALRLDKWFDPYNLEHMRAYAVLCTTGDWPKRFIPSNMEVPKTWLFSINDKMARAWVHAMRQGQIQGVSPLDE
jgi:hypothetical protein